MDFKLLIVSAFLNRISFLFEDDIVNSLRSSLSSQRRDTLYALRQARNKLVSETRNNKKSTSEVSGTVVSNWLQDLLSACSKPTELLVSEVE